MGIIFGLLDQAAVRYCRVGLPMEPSASIRPQRIRKSATSTLMEYRVLAAIINRTADSRRRRTELFRFFWSNLLCKESSERPQAICAYIEGVH